MPKLRTPGMRTIKTSLVVAICLIISKVLDLYYPYYAAIAAIICIQNTVYGSFKVAKNRVLGTIIGSLLGIFCVFIFPYNPWISGMGVLVLLYFLKVINLENAYIVACIVFLANFVPGQGPSITYSLNRTFDTIIGILIALIVNWLLSPPEYAEDIHNFSNKLIDNLFICCGNFFIHDKEIALSTIGSEILQIENLMKNYKLDIRKSKIKIINSDKLNLLIQDSNELYNHKLPFYKYEKTPYNEAFNYHVKELLKYLDCFKNLNLE